MGDEQAIGSRIVKYRNIFLVYLFMIITLGIYYVYWIVSTKRDINSKGAKIPNAILLIIPIVNLWWLWKYIDGWSKVIKKDDSTIKWFFIFFFIHPLMPGFVQSGLNKVAAGPTPQVESSPQPSPNTVSANPSP